MVVEIRVGSFVEEAVEGGQLEGHTPEDIQRLVDKDYRQAELEVAEGREGGIAAEAGTAGAEAVVAAAARHSGGFRTRS